MHAIDKAAFFDELFEYVRQIGAWPLLEQLDPQDRKRASIPYLRFVLVTLMRCVGGVQSMLASRDVLLTDEALMALVGFNAVQVQHGVTERGKSRRKKPVSICGPISYEVVADTSPALALASAIGETRAEGESERSERQHRQAGRREAGGDAQWPGGVPGQAAHVPQADRLCARRDRR